MIPERHANILEGVVESYIKTGEPVGSVALTEFMNLTCSPATVRTVLQDLEAAGYVYQPHTSAGRVPTDSGYRFYVDRLAVRKLSIERQRHIQEQLKELRREYAHLAGVASRLLSQLSESVVVCGEVESREIQEAGLRDLLRRDDVSLVDAIREISIVMDQANNYVARLARAMMPAESQVWIGQEIPFFAAQHTSLLARKVRLDSGDTVVMIMVGPKRMPYHRNLSLLNAMSNLLNDQDDTR